MHRLMLPTYISAAFSLGVRHTVVWAARPAGFSVVDVAMFLILYNAFATLTAPLGSSNSVLVSIAHHSSFASVASLNAASAGSQGQRRVSRVHVSTHSPFPATF